MVNGKSNDIGSHPETVIAMIVHRRSFVAFVAACAVGLLTAVGTASQASADPSEFVSKLAEQAITRLTSKDKSAVERSSEFRRLLAENFDVAAIGRFVLGRHWRTASEAEQAEYIKLFESMIVQTYANRFADYAGEKLRIGQAKPGDSGEFIVSSELQRPTGPPVKVDWRVRRTPQGGYKIYDVAVEGVSMSITQRDEFSSVIQRGGGKVESLLQSLRDKVGKPS